MPQLVAYNEVHAVQSAGTVGIPVDVGAAIHPPVVVVGHD